MNKTTIVGGAVIIVLIVGIAFYATQKNSPVDDNVNATSTAPGTTGTDGTGVITPPVDQVLQPGIPSVTATTNAVPSDTTVVLTGTVTPNGASTNYWFEYGTSAALGGKISNQVVGSGYMAISAPGYVTGLTKDTIYYFRLVAENGFGKVATAQYTFRTTSGVPAPFGNVPTPKTLAATNISKTGATLNGEVSPNNGSTHYWFEYGTTTTLGNAIGFTSIGSGTGKVSASVSLTKLNPATTYYFRLNAQNQFGTVISSVLSFKTK